MLLYSSMYRRLCALQGPLSGQVFLLSARIMFGRRGDTDIQILSKGVSRHHACVFEDDDGGMVLMDLSSKNGTFIGEQSIGRHELQPGDVFRIGEGEFMYEEVNGEEPTADSVNLKILSGPAEERTVMDAAEAYERTCDRDDCPALDAADWQFCPRCGLAIT